MAFELLQEASVRELQLDALAGRLAELEAAAADRRATFDALLTTRAL